ncbi:transposase [Belnapia sp. T18]|uniref:Transposase n=1 Tax=Belnapia arida TaxID=2804533 RepID=A0ABS1UDC1_9PROT|nr:transposase [Belnapia arida]
MPFKHNAVRRHHIPQVLYRIQNWPAYEAGLKRRGDLTLWLDEAAPKGWQAPRRTTPGGQAWYSDAAIELVLIMRLVFHLALGREPHRQAPACSQTNLVGRPVRHPVLLAWNVVPVVGIGFEWQVGHPLARLGRALALFTPETPLDLFVHKALSSENRTL